MDRRGPEGSIDRHRQGAGTRAKTLSYQHLAGPPIVPALVIACGFKDAAFLDGFSNDPTVSWLWESFRNFFKGLLCRLEVVQVFRSWPHPGEE
jgi:hypothetical protein